MQSRYFLFDSIVVNGKYLNQFFFIQLDSGYGFQLSIDEELKDFNYACFQAAILYTNTSGERRIKVHTISFPVVSSIHEVVNNADQEAVIGLLVKMAAERSVQSNLSDARECLINCAVDLLQTYKSLNPMECVKGLVTSRATVLIPLFISALLKHVRLKIKIILILHSYPSISYFLSRLHSELIFQQKLTNVFTL